MQNTGRFQSPIDGSLTLQPMLITVQQNSPSSLIVDSGNQDLTYDRQVLSQWLFTPATPKGNIKQ